MILIRIIRQTIRTPSLQGRLILLLLLTGLLPLLLMGGVTTFYAAHLLEIQIGNRLDDIATAMIEKQDRLMFDRVKDIQTLAVSNEMRTLAPVILTPYLNQIVRTHSPLYPLIVAVDKQGVIQATNSIDSSSTTKPGLASTLVGQSVDQTDWFRVWFDDPLPEGES